MSNVITIEPTKFESVRDGTITYGYRIYDDHEAVYCNLWESIPDDDMEVLTQVDVGADVATRGMLDFVAEEELGIFIGETYYEWDQIKHLF
jgi:hypothetical protein|tara:strand:+ start:7497 stop:7769 length:273 start_codon:yes stop_codon:yes gene_type:complete